MNLLNFLTQRCETRWCLEEEVKSPVNDDGDLPVSEPPVSENEDHSEYGTQVERDLVTDESPEVEREQLRRRLT